MLIVSQQVVLHPCILKHLNLQLLEYLSKIMSHMFFKNLFKFVCKRLLYKGKCCNVKMQTLLTMGIYYEAHGKTDRRHDQIFC